MKTTKAAGYTITAALMLALPLLVPALPAAAVPCDPNGGSAAARTCPTPPNRPGPNPEPAPTANASIVPAPPPIPPGNLPAPRTARAPAPAPAPEEAPTGDPGATPPAEVPPTTGAPAVGALIPAPTGPATTATQTPDDRDGRGVPGAILLAFGGLLVAGWAFLTIRKAL